MNIKNLYSHTTATMKTSMIREMLASTKGVPGMISFAGGFPSPETFPILTLADIFKEVITETGTDTLQYGASEGDNELKDTIIKWESHIFPSSGGVATKQTVEATSDSKASDDITSLNLTRDELLICNGATNGIYYFTRSLIEPGDIILCEGPTFLGSVVAFEAAGAKVIPIEMDIDGIIIDQLSEKIKELRAQNKTIKFLYTIPDFQNPTGITMSLSRRHELIKLMQAEDILILEDDPYRELRYAGVRVPSLFELARNEYHDNQLVTVIKSFSKILGPGLRIALAMGHEDIIKPMCSWLQKVIVNPEGVTQKVVARYIQRGYLQDHLKAIAGYYTPFNSAIIEALGMYMPPSVTFTRPQGGIFVWLSTDSPLNFDALFPEIVSKKVAYIPGSKFYPEGFEKYNCLRLNFSYPTIEQIYEGVKILGKVIS